MQILADNGFLAKHGSSTGTRPGFAVESCEKYDENCFDPALPEVLTGPAAWVGSKIQTSPEKWLVHLSPRDIADLEQAARYYLSLERDIGEITMADFPLGSFAGHLRVLTEKLIHGIGFEVLRGLPVDTYTQETAAAIFCGVGAHPGSARSQNAAGHILGHVRNVGVDPNDPNARIYQTSAPEFSY